MNTITYRIDNSSSLFIGDAVIAFGSPLGLSGTVTSGSALKSVFETHPSFNWELHNKRVMQAILPNNAKAIRTIQKNIESIILENQVSEEK